ncbi:MAG: glycosyltransferase [Vicinamibacteria bacterium]
MSAPLVSVVLPTCDRARILPRAVRSVLRQTHEQLELIVVDDASTDTTPEVLAALAAGDVRVRVLRRERSQLAGNPVNPRNLGIEAARGAYLAFLDDDDTYRPRFLERLVAELDARPELGLVYCDTVFHRRERGREVASVDRSVDFDRALLERVNYVNTTELLVRTACAREVGGWDTHIKQGSDRAFVLRVSERCGVLHVPEVLGDKYWGRDEPCQASEHYWDPDHEPEYEHGYGQGAEAPREPTAHAPWLRCSPRREPRGERLSFVTYDELTRDALALAARLPRDYRAVYGVPRSGLLPAAILATELHLPLGVVGAQGEFAGERLRAHDARPPERGPVLLVDDSCSTGGAMARAKALLAERGVRDVHTCALYVTEDAPTRLDHFARVVRPPRLFRWNLWGCVRTQRLMCDLDGVFARDPDVPDDDGLAYAAALETAPLLQRPLLPVQAIVSNRIERWRETTERWLERNGVRCGRLHLQPHACAADRRRAGDYGRFKGELYARSDALLFVESEEGQARRIHQVSGRPVLSLETERLHR